MAAFQLRDNNTQKPLTGSHSKSMCALAEGPTSNPISALLEPRGARMQQHASCSFLVLAVGVVIQTA